MKIRNRMGDVIKLRSNVCQDFLRMILTDDWQAKFYRKARTEVVNNTRFKDKYVSAYEKMRDKGVEKYSVEDMDVTFIVVIVNASYANRFDGVKPIQKETKAAINRLKNDRNITDHSSENEEPEELYLKALMDLCDLRDFIRIVDKTETTIADKQRLLFRQKYISKIDALKELLDDERIELVQKEKGMRKDIQRVLESKNPWDTWEKVYKAYDNRYSNIDRDPATIDRFIIRASDAGIAYAHNSAAYYFLHIKKDYVEFERRLLLLINSTKEISSYEAESILEMINHYLKCGNTITESMVRIIEDIKSQGYSITRTPDDLYIVNDE